MKILKIIIQTIVILTLLIAIVGWFLPREVEVYRETTIHAPMEQVYAVVNDMTQMNSWSPWHKIDPDGTTYTFEGPAAGIGSKMNWASEHKEVGTGSQEIIETRFPSYVKTKMMFGGFDAPSYATFILNEFEGNTEVKWVFETDYGSNPFFHYFSLFMDSMLGSTFEEGLANLKQTVESMPIEAEELDMSIDKDSIAVDSTQTM
ncbi:SRPBCC family protein [Reichenbachiella agarivorans]|uniref:SRPBCC family protein n=1 Tax=Reichenbachiella agarivorans TaxID=2979464 RepID=A0ABY6CRZ9_9BACT|nr:SRPBCC family protein [Reichenbachiella agarivorans]UXP31065.1 SRPBCC family protein [Reichenbachiella agarivorans]